MILRLVKYLLALMFLIALMYLGYSYTDDRLFYHKKSCFKGIVISSEKMKDADLYESQIIEYGRNEMHQVLTSEKLDEKQVKYYKVKKSDQSMFGKSVPDVVEEYNKILECNFRAHPIDLKFLNAIKYVCIGAPNKCLESFGFYRVKFDPNNQIFVNEYGNYLLVEYRVKNIKAPDDDYERIESISIMNDQTPIEYQPNLDKCFYLNVPSYSKSFSEWFYVLTKCNFFE